MPANRIISAMCSAVAILAIAAIAASTVVSAAQRAPDSQAGTSTAGPTAGKANSASTQSEADKDKPVARYHLEHAWPKVKDTGKDSLKQRQ